MFPLLILCALLFPICSRAQQDVRWNDNIAQIETRTYQYKSKRPGITIATYYPSTKQIIALRHQAGHEDFVEKTIYLFNDNATLASIEEYYDTTWIATTIYFYNSRGKRMRSTKISSHTDCRCNGVMEIVYDSLGQPIEERDCYGFTEYYSYRYDTTDTTITIYQSIRNRSFMRLGPVTTYHRHSGEVVRDVYTKFSKAEEMTYITHYTYLYDSNGNWVKKWARGDRYLRYYQERTIKYRNAR